MKAIFDRYNAIGYAMAVLSLAWLIGEAINFGWTAPITHIFEAYNILKYAILGPLEPYIEGIAREIFYWLPDDWRMQRHWNDIFVLMSLYFSARARSYLRAGLKRRALFRYFFGIPLSLMTSIIAGLVLAFSASTNAVLAAVPILGILVFELADSAVSATVARKAGLTWRQDWIRYLNFSLPILAIGLCGIIVSAYFFQDSRLAATNRLGLIFLLVFTLSLTIYWAFRAFLFALPSENRQVGESVWGRFCRSSNTDIALSMGATIGLAMIILLGSAGFETAEALMPK
ncbi:MAG: hypothetical protein ABL882_09280 [Sphingopyxis sp.]